MPRLSYLWLAVIVIAPVVRAQTITESIHGVVQDAQGQVVPGVTITATGTTSRRVWTQVTSDTGGYAFRELPPDDYSITAALDGFKTQQMSGVNVRSGASVPLDFKMEIGPIGETVVVTREAPLLDTQTGGHTVNVSGELLRSMPLSERREWFGALTLAPGVTTAEWAGGEKLLYVHGADPSANLVQIDGADVSAALGSSVRYIGLNTDTIDDIQIKTSGVDASAPLGVGGIINIATASGTNRVKGAGTLFLQPRAWNASNTPGGTSSTVDQRLLDLSVGGPLLKDHLWAFGSYRYTDVQTGVSRTAAQMDTLRMLVQGFEPFDSTNRADFWFSKLSAQLSASQQLSGFYQRDINPVASADPVAEHLRRDATGGTGASVRLTSTWSATLATRFGASYNSKRRDSETPDGDGPLRRVYQNTIASGGRLLGNGKLADLGPPVNGYSTQPLSKVTVSLDAIVSVAAAAGSHDLQAGLYAQPRLKSGGRTVFINDGFSFEESVLRNTPSDPTLVPFHRLVTDGTELTNADRKGHDYAVYVQDAWRPFSRLTVNAGVRIDRVTWTDRLFDVTTQRSTEVGPRFGINYLVTADARNTARAHFVRVHDQPATNAASVGVTALGQQDFYDVNLDGVFETVFDTPATSVLLPGRTIDSDLHQSFIHEWGTGYSRQLKGGMTAQLDFARREFRDRPTLVETNGLYNGRVFAGYRDEGFNEIYQVTNNSWNTPVYSSLEVSVTKRSARVQAMASYVRQWRHIDGTWQPNDPASFIQPDAFANDRGIGSPMGSLGSPIDANSLSGTQMTQRGTSSAQWQDHVVRGGASYVGPWHLLLATNYTFQSGAWSGPIISMGTPNPAFGPSMVVLSNGRSVSNPLSTPLRFAYNSRSDGQLTTPRLHVWNVRVGRRFTWPGLALDTGIDIFNVTNNGASASFETGANQTYNPNYGLTTFRQPPRSAQIVIRASF